MTLLGYARFYDSINGMLPSDRPDDDVIQDDVALDKWYQAYLREQAHKLGRKAKDNSGGFAVPQYQTKSE